MAASAKALKYDGDKLKAGNYKRWSHGLNDLLTGGGPANYDVRGQECPAEEMAEGATAAQKRERQADIAAWQARNKQCLFTIRNSISDAFVDQFQDAQTADELWQRVEKVFASKSKTAQRQIRHGIDNIDINLEHPNMTELVSNASGMLREYRNAGGKMDDSDLCLIVLQRIGVFLPNFLPIVQTLALRAEDDDLSLDELSSKLSAFAFDEEERDNLHVGMRNRTTPGLVASVRHGRGGKSPASVTCRWCEKFGHYEADCRARANWLEGHPKVKELLDQEKKTQALSAKQVDITIPYL